MKLKRARSSGSNSNRRKNKEQMQYAMIESKEGLDRNRGHLTCSLIDRAREEASETASNRRLDCWQQQALV